MVIEKKGNIFENYHQAYAHVLNGDGKMDNGISAVFKKLYPKMYLSYHNLCAKKILKSGSGYFYKSINELPSVFNLVIKSNFYIVSKYYFIQNIIWMHEEAYRQGITDIAMTSQKFGLGHLSKEDLISSLTEYIINKRIHITLYI